MRSAVLFVVAIAFFINCIHASDIRIRAKRGASTNPVAKDDSGHEKLAGGKQSGGEDGKKGGIGGVGGADYNFGFGYNGGYPPNGNGYMSGGIGGPIYNTGTGSGPGAPYYNVGGSGANGPPIYIGNFNDPSHIRTGGQSGSNNIGIGGQGGPSYVGTGGQNIPSYIRTGGQGVPSYIAGRDPVNGAAYPPLGPNQSLGMGINGGQYGANYPGWSGKAPGAPSTSQT